MPRSRSVRGINLYKNLLLKARIEIRKIKRPNPGHSKVWLDIPNKTPRWVITDLSKQLRKSGWGFLMYRLRPVNRPNVTIFVLCKFLDR